jgi:hypothetical protein
MVRKGAHVYCTDVNAQFPQQCKWPKCIVSLRDTSSALSHAQSHVQDDRGQYQCSKCDDYYMDILMLAYRERGCKGPDCHCRFKGAFELTLHDDATNPAPHPSLRIVARSSSGAPSSWYCKLEYLDEGLKVLAQRVVNNYKAYTSMAKVPAHFVAMYDIHTRYTPTGKHAQTQITTNPSIRSYHKRAHQFTTAIDKALGDMAVHHTNPVIMSVALDGLACETSLIAPWLERRVEVSSLVFVFTSIRRVHESRCLHLRYVLAWMGLVSYL